MLTEKDREWGAKCDQLERELNSVLHHSYHESNMASMSRAELEREMRSLAAVVDMKSAEIRQGRIEEERLRQRVEAAVETERELYKAKQRLEEMSIVVQNKMVAEK